MFAYLLRCLHLLLIVAVFFGAGVLMVSALADEQRAAIKPVNLRCEYLTDPLGIDVWQPRMSCQVVACDPAVVAESEDP